ncbi:hypothetical protein P0L94_16740 [Microbacter sp. GSS18]|nr:hypothetical protein P0L94_16740 [Microbacter sp. GSS18]
MIGSVSQRSEFFYFQTDLRLHESLRAGVTVAFCAERYFDSQRLGEGLKAAVAFPNDPALVLVLGLEPNAEAFSDIRGDLEDWVPPDVKIATALLSHDRRLTIWGDNPEGILDEKRLEEYCDELFVAGLEEMFYSGSTVIRSAPGYHFEAPGGKHMSTFVRAGSMFTDSARTAFAACSILDKIGSLGSIRYVSTDTSSINALAYELRRLQDVYCPDEPAAVVGSFGGHRAFDQRLSLDPARSTLFLVSVSSTGSLIRRILDERDGARIVVLVAVGETIHGSSAMYSPGVRAGSENGIDDVDAEAQDRRSCHRCTNYNETVVKIDGEQLLPLTPSVYSRLLIRDQARAWEPRHLEAIVALDAVQAHYVPKTRGKNATRRPIYLEFEAFLGDLDAPKSEGEPDSITTLREETVAKLRGMTDKLRPTHIVYLSDPSSEALARSAQRLSGLTPTLLEARALLSGTSGIDPHRENRILIVASAVSSGSAINSVSRDIRPFVERSSVSYFVFLARTQDGAVWNFVRSNLMVGKHTAGSTNVESVISAWLPSEKTLLGSVWDHELSFWDKIARVSEYGSKGGHFASALEQVAVRRDRLESGGLRDDLFLSASSDINDTTQPLRLNPNFAFWSFGYDPSSVRQSAVYMTFAAVLDWSRSPGGRKDPADYHLQDAELEIERYADTTQRQHNLTALHPFNFDRYNDAVTNCALLRGALPWELDYSASPGLSASMLGVLDGVVERYERSPAESPLVEYLLAIASRRLRLHPAHLDLFLERLNIELPPVARLLAHYIVSSLIDGPLTAAAASPAVGESIWSRAGSAQ